MSRELSDIERALQDGRAAAGWMRERSTHWSSRETADHYLQSIKDGLKACEQLRQHLKDGRKHIDVPEDAYDVAPRAANLEKADEGYRLCENCEGVGTHMVARMYPTGHTECTEECPDCGGEGQIEIDEVRS